MLTISGLTKAFGERSLFADVSLQVNRQDRIGLVGPNGAGKSTLFSLILGTDSPDQGEIIRQRNVRLGYLPQESAPAGDQTVLELATAISAEFASLRRQVLAWDAGHPGEDAFHDDAHDRFNEMGGYQLDARAKKMLRGLGFRESDYHRPAREMSGGWVMRAHLARLLVQEPDLLMLDEPTNHLDLESIEALVEGLKAYTGTLIVVSHDRWFIGQLATRVVDIEPGGVTDYSGTYEEYVAFCGNDRFDAEQVALAEKKKKQKKLQRAGK